MHVPMNTVALERVAPPWKQVDNYCLGSLGAIILSATVDAAIYMHPKCD